MDKDKLLAALYALQTRAKKESYLDEIETLITLVVNGEEASIAAAWEDLRTDHE